jgi:hypothetical protein
VAPVLRNDSSHDLSDMFQIIADALNVKHRYGFLRDRMELSVAQYNRGDISKMGLADDLLKMLTVVKKDEKEDAPLFAEHGRMLANYERTHGNYGG